MDKLNKIEEKKSTLAKRLPESEFSVKYSPANCIKLYKDQTSIKLALKSGAGSLSQIKKGYGEEFQKLHVMLFIIDLQEKLGVKNKMNQAMLEECTDFIISDYWYFNLADMNLIFTRAKKGFYGQFYESVSMPKILEWFSSYSDERAGIAERTNLNEDKQRESSKNEAQIKYAEELFTAHEKNDYRKVDEMLKTRKNSSEEDFEEQKRDLENKLKGHIDFISKIAQMKAIHENPLMQAQYDKEIFIIKAQKKAVEIKLNSHLEKYNLTRTKERKMKNLDLIAKSLDLIEAEKENNGVVKCPKCESDLHFEKLESGNIKATCEIVDCFSFKI